MSTSALSRFRANDPYEQLISNITTIEREPQLALKPERSEHKRLGRTDVSLSAFFGASGPQSFSIFVARPADAAPSARADVAVTDNSVGTTDEEILREVSTAINDAMPAATEYDEIGSTERTHASRCERNLVHYASAPPRRIDKISRLKKRLEDWDVRLLRRENQYGPNTPVCRKRLPHFRISSRFSFSTSASSQFGNWLNP